MFLRLMKLIIRSRFSWTYFLIVFLFIVYAAMSAIGFGNPSQNSLGQYYFAGVLGLFAAASALIGGLTMTKSDSEFLMVSAVKRRTLAFALYAGQYLYTGPIILSAFAVLTLAVPYGAGAKALIFLGVCFLSTFPVSLNTSSTNMRLPFRIAIAALVLIWIFSFLLGFQYSPISLFHGHVVEAVGASIIVSSLLLLRSFMLLSSEDIAIKVLDIRRRSSEYRNIKDYSSLSPLRAILLYGFSQFELASRSNLSGTPTLTGRRIRINIVLAVFVAIAVVYGYIIFIMGPALTGSNNTPDSLGYLFVVIFATIYIGVFPPLIMSGSTIPMERAWLSFTSLNPSSYMPMLIGAKMVQMLYLLSPFFVVDIVLFFMGFSYALSNILIFAVYDPLFLALFIALNFRAINYQITEEALITSRFNASQFILIPFVFLFFGVAGVSSIFPIAGVVVVPVMALAIYLIFRWKDFWNNRLFNLVEKGFI